MGLTPAEWLIDKSALARVHMAEVGVILRPRVQAGKVAVSILTELEVGYSARSTSDYRAQRSTLIDHLLPILLPVRSEQRAREVQAQLNWWNGTSTGQSRSPISSSPPPRNSKALIVLHYDGDFDLIADITDSPPNGSSNLGRAPDPKVCSAFGATRG